MPKLPLLKEWTFAGFFFAMSGAIVSHVGVGNGALKLFGLSLFIILTEVSWYFRPADRKIGTVS